MSKKKYYIPDYRYLQSRLMKGHVTSDRAEWWLLLIGLAYVLFR